MKVVLGRDDLAQAALGAARQAGAPAERLDVSPVYKAAKGFVNESSPDVCEIPIVTLLQATAYGKPVVLLPLTAHGRYQHQTLVSLSGLTTADLAGRRIGVRSWGQTTGVWLRGFLTEQYGIDLRASEWFAYEDGHIYEHRDPEWVHRPAQGAKLAADFLEGRLDLGILGNELPKDERIRPVIADAQQAAETWSREKGFIPINHVIGVNEQTAREHSAAILAAYDAMRAVTEAAAEPGPITRHPVGFAALRGPFTQAAAYAVEQEVLPKPVEFDELIERSCAALGVPASRLGG
ncbi:MAG TPA: hypothetical protein VGM10_10570 [Actinocrinis sp.]